MPLLLPLRAAVNWLYYLPYFRYIVIGRCYARAAEHQSYIKESKAAEQLSS
jgi:hypothetical protein